MRKRLRRVSPDKEIGNTNLVHLLQLQGNQTKARHELVQTLFPENTILLFLA